MTQLGGGVPEWLNDRLERGVIWLSRILLFIIIEQSLQQIIKGLVAQVSESLVHLFSIFYIDQCRDGRNLVLLTNLRIAVFIDVDFEECPFACIGFQLLSQSRHQGLAWSTPISIEINKDWRFDGLQLLLELFHGVYFVHVFACREGTSNSCQS